MKYDAFISYSHSADSELAPSLEEGLEKFAKPIFKRSALHIFRDSNDLSASPNLWGTIEAGLAASDYFIFMASPRAAQSKWCQKEVEFWKANKKVDHFLIVLTDGELVWDDAKGDFDWNKTTAIPSNLSGVFENEPLFVDFREKPAALSLDDPDFQQKIVLLAATIHGRTIEDMIGEGVRQHKRTIRIRNGAIAVLSMLLIAAIGLGVFALQQKSVAEVNEQKANEKAEEAEQERNRANQQANKALANSYLLGSKENLDIDPTLAIKLAVHGYQFAREREMEMKDFQDQLIQAFYNSSHFYTRHDGFDLPEEFKALPFTNQPKPGQTFIEDDSGNLFVQTKKGRTQLQVPNDQYISEIDSFAFSPNGNYLAVFFLEFYARNIGQGLLIFSMNGELIANAQTVDEMRDARTLPPPCIRSSADGKRVLVCSERETMAFENDANGFFRRTTLAQNSAFLQATISPDGRFVALGDLNGQVHLIQLKGEQDIAVEQKWIIKGHHGEPLKGLAFTPDSEVLLSQSDSYKHKWKINGLQPYIQLKEKPELNLLESDTYGDEGRVHLSIKLESFPDLITYLNTRGDTLAKFENNIDFSQAYERGTRLNGGDYYLTPDGLFNSENERLIRLDLSTTFLGMGYFEASGFSTDGNYLFARDRIYLLDPEAILARYQNLGAVAPFTPEEKERYLIQ